MIRRTANPAFKKNREAKNYQSTCNSPEANSSISMGRPKPNEDRINSKIAAMLIAQKSKELQIRQRVQEKENQPKKQYYCVQDTMPTHQTNVHVSEGRPVIRPKLDSLLYDFEETTRLSETDRSNEQLCLISRLEQARPQKPDASGQSLKRYLHNPQLLDMAMLSQLTAELTEIQRVIRSFTDKKTPYHMTISPVQISKNQVQILLDLAAQMKKVLHTQQASLS